MKTAVYQLRLDPEKKAEWQKRAENAGMRLGPWIESMCDRPDVDRSEDGFQENLSRGIHERAVSLWMKDAAEEAKSLHREGKTIPLGRRHARNCTCASCRVK